MNITFVLYDKMTALDLVGPYQVLTAIPGATIRLAAPVAGPIRTDTGMQITADHALDAVGASDVVIVPGTGQPSAPLSDLRLIQWLRAAAPEAGWMCSVCTGSLLLGAAGVLAGRRATTHWLALPMLSEFGAEPVAERVVFDGRLVTAAGVSAGIDMALALVSRLADDETAQTIQLALEYDPQPPYSAGSPRTAPRSVVDKATAALQAAATG